jgi:hypothetical protein
MTVLRPRLAPGPLAAALLAAALFAAGPLAAAPLAGAERASDDGSAARDAAAPPATGSAKSWIVTTGGERIETRGPWRVEGRRVVYVAANGTLVSLRADRVDLEASRALASGAHDGAKAASPRPPLPAEPPREPRLVLTDEDLPPITTPATPGEEGAPAEGAEGAEPGARPPAATGPPAASGDLTVVEWRDVSAPGEPLRVYGTLRNDSRGRRSGLAVTVKVYDEGGNELASQQALLQDGTLEAGRSTGFRVFFPEVGRYERIELVPSHR